MAAGPHHFTTVASRLGWFHYTVNLDVWNKDKVDILNCKKVEYFFAALDQNLILNFLRISLSIRYTTIRLSSVTLS